MTPKTTSFLTTLGLLVLVCFLLFMFVGFTTQSTPAAISIGIGLPFGIYNFYLFWSIAYDVNRIADKDKKDETKE